MCGSPTVCGCSRGAHIPPVARPRGAVVFLGGAFVGLLYMDGTTWLDGPGPMGGDAGPDSVPAGTLPAPYSRLPRADRPVGRAVFGVYPLPQAPVNMRSSRRAHCLCFGHTHNLGRIWWHGQRVILKRVDKYLPVKKYFPPPEVAA